MPHTITCPACKGKGEVKCHNSPPVYPHSKCPKCRGTLWHSCPRCKGRGTIASSGGGCFITTATLSAVGNKDDSCQELRLFRNYRDNWLSEQKGGQQLIDRYYEVAPQIVAIISRRIDSQVIFDAIWQNYLLPCFAYIQEGQFVEARTLYTEMVLGLEKRFLGENQVILAENFEPITA